MRNYRRLAGREACFRFGGRKAIFKYLATRNKSLADVGMNEGCGKPTRTSGRRAFGISIVAVITALLVYRVAVVPLKYYLIMKYIRKGECQRLIDNAMTRDAVVALIPELISIHQKALEKQLEARKLGEIDLLAFNDRITTWNALLIVVHNGLSDDAQCYVTRHVHGPHLQSDELFNCRQWCPGIADSRQRN
jgi:hypothetical protein